MFPTGDNAVKQVALFSTNERDSMWGSRNPRGTAAVMALMVLTIILMATLTPDKLEVLNSLALIAAFALIMLGEALLLCRVHYGESPSDVWKRIKHDK